MHLAILEGVNVGKRLKAEAVIIDGSLDEIGEQDLYRFRLHAGDKLNEEVMSMLPEYDDPVVASIALYYEDESTMSLVKIAENFQEFESLGPV